MKDNSADERANSFDFLRLFAAVCVVVSHTTEHLHLPFLWHTPKDPFWFYEGVEMFFILSGFLVYRSYAKCVETGRPVWQYFVNRFLRVAPALYVYAVITALLLLGIGLVSPADAKTVPFLGWFASNFFLVPVYTPTIFKSIGVGVLNGSLWSIPAEFSFYVGLPIIYWIGKRFRFQGMMILLFTMSVIGLVLNSWALTFDPEPMISKLFRVTCLPFLLFFTLGIYWSTKWATVRKHSMYALVCAVLYVAGKLDVFHLGPVIGDLTILIWALPFSYLVIWLGHYGAPWMRKITHVGDLSYGVYIWHMIVVNLFLVFGIPTRFNAVPGTLIVMAVIVLALCLAYASWHLVEKRALRWKPFTSNTSHGATTQRAAPLLIAKERQAQS